MKTLEEMELYCKCKGIVPAEGKSACISEVVDILLTYLERYGDLQVYTVGNEWCSIMNVDEGSFTIEEETIELPGLYWGACHYPRRLQIN
ncbi:MAG: hypothetical protein GY861_21930 [bacterium]|nr:hypothetical protein [bacterium]